MANDFKVEIPISFGGESKAGKKLADDFMRNIKGSFQGFGKSVSTQSTGVLPGIGKIATSVGIIASIWQGIAPILKPVLKMLSILLTILLLPLMPLIKQMVSGLAKTAQNVGAAQQEAGGGYAGFVAGLVEVMKSPTIWAIAGVGLAASFTSSLLGGAGLAGALALAIGLGLVFTSIGEDEIKNKIAAAGLVGISAGIAAAIVTGSPIVGLLVGVLTYSLASKFLPDNILKEDIVSALKSAGIVGIATALAVGIMTGNPILGLLAGTLTFALSLVFDLKKEKIPEFEEGEIEKAMKGYSGTGILKMPTIDGMSISLDNMKDVSVEATNEVIGNLSRIPNEITTTHYIRTVYE